MKNLVVFSLAFLCVSFAQWSAAVINDPAPKSRQYPDVDEDEYNYPGICWLHTYARYNYSFANTCDEGLVQIGAYCYQPCKQGYLPGFSMGYNEADTAGHYSDLFEFTSDAESFCYKNCPGDSAPIDDGTDCYFESDITKNKWYNRTEVDQLECPEGLDLFNGSCYAPPRKGYVCEGPLCLGRCPEGWGFCGAFCTNKNYCTGETLNEGFDVKAALVDMAFALDDPSKEDWVNATAVPGVKNGTQYHFCH